MRRLLLIALLCCLAALPAAARQRAFGWCAQGGVRVYVSNVGSAAPAPSFAPTYFDQSYPNCTVTVYLTGTLTLATLYSDNAGTPLANPFTANSNGYWAFYADRGRYDVRFSGTAISSPFTTADIQLCDVISENCAGTGGGGTQTPHNLLAGAPVVPDTEAFSPPVIGDLIWGDGTGKWVHFTGNTANSTLCLQQTGNGTAVVSQQWGACSPPTSNATYQHNNSVVAAQPALNILDTPSVTASVTNDSANNRVNVSFSSTPTITPPPPLQPPTGQFVAWAFPTTCTPSVGNGGATTVLYDWSTATISPGDARYVCGNTGGILTRYGSGPLHTYFNYYLAWGGFQMPTLPSDAVIQNIYGVTIANRPGPQVGFSTIYCSSGATTANLIGATTASYSGYLSNTATSLGSTTSAVTSATCGLVSASSVSIAGNDPQTVQMIGLAIYYTTSQQPSSTSSLFYINPYYPSINGVSTSWTSVADGSPITYNLGAQFIANGITTLNHTTPTRALNVTNMQVGGRYHFAALQDATGGAALTLGSGCTWYVNNVATTTLGLSTAANAVQEFSWTYDGSRCYVDTMAGSGGGSSGLAYLGTWLNTTAYVTNNIVSLNGSSYIALSNNTGVQPGTDGGVTWAVLAAAGAQGPAGPSGINGTNGSNGAPGAPGYSPNQILSGCGVAYASGLSFNVSACSYVIQNVTYGSPAATVTLTAADPSLDRIDVIAVDTTGTAIVVTGTPASNPAPPSIDISTQLQLTFAYVAAGASTPSNITTTDIYHENAEWTCASSAHVVCNSTSNPHSGTVDIEATAPVAGNYARLTIPSGTIDISQSNNLVFWIRSKAAWSGTSLTLQWYNGTTAKCTPVSLANGNFGFSSSNITTYQQIVVPTSVFACAGIPVTRLQFTLAGATTTGFYLDDIILQGGLPQSSGSSGMRWAGPWASTTTYAVNDTVTYQNLTYTAIQASTNLPPATNPTSWAVHSFSVAGSVGNLQYNAGTNLLAGFGTTISGTSITFPGDILYAGNLISTDTVDNTFWDFITGSSGDSTCPTPASGHNYLCNQSGVINMVTGTGTYSPIATQAKTARTCAIIIGAQGSPALVTTDITPQNSQCYADTAMTVQTIIVKVDSGASTVQLGYVHSTGGAPTTTNYTAAVMTPALVTNINGAVVCANAGGTAITLNGVSVTCGTLATQVWNAGDTLSVSGGVADGVTERMSIFITATVN